MRRGTRGVHVGAGEGRCLRVLSSRLEIKAGADVELSFGMFESSFPPGTGMPFLHLHRSYEEAFYVLEGEVQFQLGSAEEHAGPGSAILIPARVPHCFRNVGSGDVRWLVVTVPADAVTLIEEAGAVAPGDLDRLAELFESYDSELLERHPHWTDSQPPPTRRDNTAGRT
jgi:mannose-6-phosphate isomerase-like protein (cupin superfamily)